MFEWDEAKRLTTLEKHDLDFYDVIGVFDQDYLRLHGQSETEKREIAVGILNRRSIAVIYTMRGNTTRIITARNARRDEREKLDAYLAGRSEKE